MAASSKMKDFVRDAKERLDALCCPLTEGTDEDWVRELIFKPGEPRLKLLEWLLSKFDSRVGEALDPASGFRDVTSDSRIRKLLFIFSSLGLCRYDDVDLVMGVESTYSRQMLFIDHLLNIVRICDTAEEPMNKPTAKFGIISEATPLEDQLVADCRYVDSLASQQVHTGMFGPTVQLLPPDFAYRIKQDPEILSSSPDLQVLLAACNTAEDNLACQIDVLEGVNKVTAGEKIPADSKTLKIAARSLELLLQELSQLVLSFIYCYETDLQVWCQKEVPNIPELGPAFRRVHALVLQFAQLLTDVQKMRKSHNNLNKGISTNRDDSAFLVKTTQAAAQSFQECVSILEETIQRQNTSTSSSLCSSMLKM